MATNVFARRLVALGVCASLGVFTSAMVAGPAFAAGKGKKHTTATTSKKGKKKASTSKGKTTTALATELKKIETSVKGQKHATFIATYTFTTASGAKKVTFAQQPPKSLFKATGETIISTGTTTLICSTTGTSATGTSTTGGSSGNTCEKSTGADPLAALLDLFSGTSALEFFNSAAAQAEAKSAGVTVSFSSGTYAGLASKCVSVSKSGATEGKYCVATSEGILDYFAASGSGATLNKFSSSVPAGTFTAPAGATIVTEPGA
jgi:hypothetical protein